MTRARDLSNLIGSGNYTSTTFTATAGQTVFTIAHTQGFIQVFMNGLLLDETTDYSSNGTAVTLTQAATAGDELEVVKYNTFSVGDAITQTDADNRYVNTTGDTMTGQLVVQNASATSTTAQTNLNARFVSNASNADSHIQISNGVDHSANIGIAGGANLYFANDGVERMRIDGAGRVTMPYQPAFKAYNPQGSFPSGAGYLTFPNTRLNVGNVYSTSTGRFTAPVSGNYFIAFGALFDNTTTVHLHIRVNGAQQEGLEVYDDGTTAKNVSTSSVIPLSANDWVQVYVNTSGARVHQRYGTFSGHLIG